MITGPDRLLPDDLAARAREYADAGGSPVSPRDAATIALLRDGTTGLEVYVLRRVATMAFASGMHVFPGGTVDPRDLDHDSGWVGPAAERMGRPVRRGRRRAPAGSCSRRFGRRSRSPACCSPVAARTAVGLHRGLVADTAGDDWEDDRLALIDRTLVVLGDAGAA